MAASTNQVFVPKMIGAENVMCRFKWDYPIVNLISGHIRNCCRTPKQTITADDLTKYGKDAIMNLPYELERRKEKLLGYTHRDCATCLHLEEVGAPAPRSGTSNWVNQYYSKETPYKSIKEADQIISKLAQNLSHDDSVLKSNTPEMLEIVLGNVCNFKCTYCSVHYSNTWAKELISFGDLSQKDYQEQFPAAPEKLESVFWEWFYDVARHSLKSINFLGGEPTLIPNFYKILDKLVLAYDDLGSRKKSPVFLGVITNLSMNTANLNKFTASFSRLIPNFHIRLQPSMESLGSRAEYIRNGLEWSTFEKNLRHIIEFSKINNFTKDQFLIGFQMAINSLSVSSLPQFIKWVEGLNDEYKITLGLLHNIVSDPSHHSPLILTPDFAKYLDEARNIITSRAKEFSHKIAPFNFGSWCDFNSHVLDGLHDSIAAPKRTEHDLNARRQFYEFLKKNDSRRNSNFIETFPEYENFYNLCECS